MQIKANEKSDLCEKGRTRYDNHCACASYNPDVRSGFNWVVGSTYLVNKLHSFLALDCANGGHLLVVEEHTVKLVGSYEHLRPEGGGDELGSWC